MSHKTFTKAERLQVYDKFNGHCAYCGQPIELKDMQIDHKIPLLRTSGKAADWQREHWYGSTDDPNDFDNLMPSCRACNYRKSSAPLEVFRREIEHGLVCCNRDFTYRLMKRYGLVEEHPHKVVFYFETL